MQISKVEVVPVELQVEIALPDGHPPDRDHQHRLHLYAHRDTGRTGGLGLCSL